MLFTGQIVAQTPAPTVGRSTAASANSAKEAMTRELADNGIVIETDKRLIVVMAALEFAGFDPTPGKEPSVFRKRVQEDQTTLNPELRRKMKEFFDRGNKMRNRTTPADQVAPYVSMIYSLSPVPELADPPKTDDLPGELLDVLDFAPLLREFYRRSNIEEKMPEYSRAYNAAGEEIMPSAVQMARDLLSYLHTRPVKDYVEIVKTQSKTKRDGTIEKVEAKPKERRFFIVPDLMSVRGTVNFRNVGDDYYVIVPPGTNLVTSEARRAYLQYIFDPLVAKTAKEIAPHREGIKKLLEEREKKGVAVSPDIFLSVTRSLVAASDARQEEFQRINVATYNARQKIAQAKDDAAKQQISKDLAALKAESSDEMTARLSEAYERGAVLSFYFSEQLKGMEESGFDVSGAMVDIFLSLDPSKETDRLIQTAEARKRAVAAREERKKRAAEMAQVEPVNDARNTALIAKLREVEEMIRLKTYDQGEDRLAKLQVEYPGDPRVVYYRGLVADSSASIAIDETVRDERLNRAAAHYRSTILLAQGNEDYKAISSQAHVRLGSILEFNDQNEAAKAEYEAAEKIGQVDGGAYQKALAGKQRLQKP